MNSFIVILIIEENKLDFYYKRLNYLNKDYLIKIINNASGFNNKLVKKLRAKNITNYESCKADNFTKYNSLIFFKKAISLFIIDIDIVGSFKIKGLKGESYFISLTDKDSRVLWIYAIKYKF